MTPLKPDRDQVETFVTALFKHAGTEGFVTCRSFPDDASIKPFSIKSAFLEGGLKSVVDIAVDEAANAANAPLKIVFCPPIAIFKGTRLKKSWQAREQDVLRGLALSVECDERAQAARVRLEKMLGPATIVTLSGGQWKDPTTSEVYPKLHLHWRLKTPAEGKAQLAALKKARDLATMLVGGDPTNKAICHPIRWPGSWHRKGEPVLCRIETENLDREIELDAALKALTGASGNGHDNSGGRGLSDDPHDNPATSDDELIADVNSGHAYHGPLVQLAARWIGRGKTAEETIAFLRGLMNQSAGKRDDRWHGRYDDIPRSVETAVQTYGERRAGQIARNIEIGEGISEPILPTILTLDEMLERLVFIGSTGAVADRTTGRLRKKEAAYAEYAASKHSYKDKAGDDQEGPALKFWIGSPQRVSVDVLTWFPGQPQVCRPPESTDGARTAFNSWRGLAPMDAPEDWKERSRPFFDHVTFLVPVEAERERFLQWLAHIVQRPEVLPHTSYLLTTATTGIGRNLMASIIVRVLSGHVAVGVSLPELLDGGFTGRLSRKLLAIVDEAREGSGDRRYQRAERLKSLLTEEHRHVNPKYGVQSVEKNCCRWLMFSNHRDAIPFDNSDRRVEVIENPTVRKTTEYYERLYGLLDDPAFIGSVRRQLEHLDIASFRPGAHATMNRAKLQALDEMMTETERAVFEFKENCKTKLAPRTAIRDCVCFGPGSGNVSENHLAHAIKRAGMVNTGKRVKKGEVRHAVVIVGGPWTLETVEAASDEALLKAMGL
jgi:hypothetical protein